MSLLVLGDILGVLVNTLTSDAKYPVQVCEKFYSQFKWILWKTKSFFPIFCSISGISIRF